MDLMYQPSSPAAHGAIVERSGVAPGTPVQFAGFRLEADGSLFRGSSLIHLPPKELAALRLLLAKAGQIVSASEVKQVLWGDLNVTADSVPKCLSSLRARLQPDECIQTVYKRGYRLMADIRKSEQDSVAVLPRLAIPPFVREVGVPDHLGISVVEETIFRLSNAHTTLFSFLRKPIHVFESAVTCRSGWPTCPSFTLIFCS